MVRVSDGPKRKASDQKKTPPSRSGAAAVTQFLFRPPVLIVIACAVASTFVVPLVRESLPDLKERPEYVVRMCDVEIPTPPSWVPRNFVEQVVERAGLPETACILDPELTHNVAEAFRLHPWTADVISVRKRYPAGMTVDLTYRVPVAVVRVKRGMYPVDGHGVLLPPDDFSAAIAQKYPLIENASSTPQGAAGTEWGDPAVHGAARLAATLGPYWQPFGLKAIRIPLRTKSNAGLDDLTFKLITGGGTHIIWGRAPGIDYPGELSADLKIGRLEKYLADFGDFDEPLGPYEIDIRHWQEISRRPLAASRERLVR